MRIGIIGPASPDSFGDNIGHCLTQMGHDVIYLGSLRPRARVGAVVRAIEVVRQAYPAVEDRAHFKVADKAVELRCDVVVVTDYGLVPMAVEHMRKHGLPVALWFPDAVVNMGRCRMLDAPYTALFFKDRLLVERLKNTLDIPV